MKIRSCFVGLVLVCISLSNSYGQVTLVINSLTVVPANPTPQDTLLLLANCTFSASGCNAYDTSISMIGNNIYVNSIHCLGLLPALCDYTDTFKLEPLPSGTYQFKYHVDEGFGGPPCTPGIVPGPSDSINFVVDLVSTNYPLPTAEFEPLIALFPNPATNKLHYSMSGYSFNDLRLLICSLDGAVLGSYLLKTNIGVLDLNLNNGIYVCFFKNEELLSKPRKLIVAQQ